MNYPNFIDYNNFNNVCNKFYDINIIERNIIYPFTYIEHNNIEDNIVDNNTVNNFIRLPLFENLVLDQNGLPFIPLNA